MSSPGVWTACFEELEGHGRYEEALEPLSKAEEWVFVGCGSSYSVAQAAAWSWTALTGRKAKAVPGSELLFYPDQVPGKVKCQPVLISRSGRTTEMVRVAEDLEGKRGIRTMAICCATGERLEQIVTSTLAVPAADEQSAVMTRSFTSMLLALQGLAAWFAKQEAFLEALRRMPAGAEAALAEWRSRLEKFVQSREFDDYVFLGQGPFMSLASEGQMKVTEMACAYAQVFHTLEFRHGPKSIVSPKTLLTFFLGEGLGTAEQDVLKEMKELGATTLVITNWAGNAVRRAADLLIELKLEVPEVARLAACLMPAQLLGLYLGLKRGYDPDQPPNLGRAVVLKDKKT